MVWNDMCWALTCIGIFLVFLAYMAGSDIGYDVGYFNATEDIKRKLGYRDDNEAQVLREVRGGLDGHGGVQQPLLPFPRYQLHEDPEALRGDAADSRRSSSGPNRP